MINSPTLLTKADYAANFIRSNILAGNYPPGSRLVLRTLANRLGMSELPVREALRRLEIDGFVQYKHNAGAMVTKLDRESYNPMQKLMAYLEGAVMAEAAESIDWATIAECREIIVESKGLLESSQVEVFDSLSMRFHDAIAAHCSNGQLIELWRSQQDKLSLIRKPLLPSIMSLRSQYVADHEDILELYERSASPNEIQMAAQTHRLRSLTLEDDAPASDRGA